MPGANARDAWVREQAARAARCFRRARLLQERNYRRFARPALRAVLRPLANELSSRGVRLNAVSPGPIETPIYGKLGMSSEQLTGFSEQVMQSVPLGRFGQADEVAQAVAFLSSSSSSYIQGVELAVDGGMSQV